MTMFAVFFVAMVHTLTKNLKGEFRSPSEFWDVQELSQTYESEVILVYNRLQSVLEEDSPSAAQFRELFKVLSASSKVCRP
jgi:hypothetical protein